MEEYIHLQESITSLNRAWRTVCELRETPAGSAIWAAAYRMTIIEYCKPFKSSKGADRRHKIQGIKFREEEESLHQRLIELRDTVLAHNDLGPLDAKIVYSDSSTPLLIKNSLPQMPAPDAIKHLIERVLDELYIRAEKTGSAL